MCNDNSIYCLDDKVPKMDMSEETADISQFYEFVQCNWIIYCQGTVEYPEELFSLSKHLESMIYVGLSTTVKIL